MLPIEDDGGGLQLFAEVLQLFELALAHEGRGDGQLEALLQLPHHHSAGLLGKAAQLAKRVGFVVDGAGQTDSRDDGSFGGDTKVVFARGHGKQRGSRERKNCKKTFRSGKRRKVSQAMEGRI
jgi:hypothetical protein